MIGIPTDYSKPRTVKAIQKFINTLKLPSILFRNLFNKKNKKTVEKQDQPLPKEEEIIKPISQEDQKILKAEFNQAVARNIQRYLSAPGTQMELELKAENGNPIGFAEAYPTAFAEWEKIESLWDKRTVIYNLLDGLLGPKLELWQKIMRLVDDRFAEKALTEAQNMSKEDFEDANYWAAKAKMCLVLTNYKEAERSAQKALELDSSNRLAKLQLADSYQVLKKTDQAIKLYQELVQTSRKALENQGKRLQLNIEEMVGFEGDIIHSPFYAVSILHQTPNVGLEQWEQLAAEFYWSPHFRAQHAYFMLQDGKPLEGLFKLVTITKEMPWFKEAVINSQRLIIEMKGEEALAHELERLDKIIKEKGWS
jgi:tetratricopeptide (TPR) repeat protein